MQIDALLRHLDLERLEENLFRGESRDLCQGSVFGGQVLGQALVAAGQTVKAGLVAHSLHGYFLRPGDVAAPIVYEVDRIRDGRSFTTRRVVAVQHGRPIFHLATSFQVEEEGIAHQSLMPAVPGPEGLPSNRELAGNYGDDLPEGVRRFLTREMPLEFRPVDPDHPLRPRKRPPKRQIWMRTEGSFEGGLLLHQAVLAYASDFSLLPTALLPHGLSLLQPGLQAASLDHAMWFHRPFRADEWLLYDMDSPSASGARGFARGQIFSADGMLVASVAQEGLIRQWKS